MNALFEEGLGLIGDAREKTTDAITDVEILSKGLELYYAGIEKVRSKHDEDTRFIR